MAVASKVLVSTENVGIYHRPGITAESAEKVTELLQKNHDEHHIFFNLDGFHVHDAAIYRCKELTQALESRGTPSPFSLCRWCNTCGHRETL
jgi:hypothetical protein